MNQHECIDRRKVQALDFRNNVRRSISLPSEERTDRHYFPYVRDAVYLSRERLRTGGNRKLHNVWTLDLPAGLTCARDCAGCYAQKAERLYPDVFNHRMANFLLALYKRDLFHRQLDDQLANIKAREANPVVRIHSSGDFFSRSYTRDIFRLAGMNLGIRFFAFSKSPWAFQEARPWNFSLIDSRLPFKGKNYTSDVSRLNKAMLEGYHLCPASLGNGQKCNLDCTYCFTADNHRVVFKEH